MGCKESTTQYFKLKTWPTFLLSSVYLLLFYKKKKKILFGILLFD